MSDHNAAHEIKGPIGYLRGQYVAEQDMRLPVSDLGFVHGAAVVETLRTFRHVLFKPEQHWERLEESIRCLGIDPAPVLNDVRRHAPEILKHNAACVDADTELSMIVFVTAGPNPGYLGVIPPDDKKPTLGIHTFPMTFELWYKEWEAGQKLWVTSIPAMPSEIISPEIKYRSRLHWYLADLEAAAISPGTRALLRNSNGCVTETSIGNIIMTKGKTLYTPGRTALWGVSLDTVISLALAHVGPVIFLEGMTLESLHEADEVFVTSTSSCMMHVQSVQGQQIGDGKQGPIFKKLLAAWSELVQVDIAQQIRTQGHARSQR
jgi:branched-subunit amino acid aminotransferase/4-amino-4-deoxychorismate lyase